MNNMCNLRDIPSRHCIHNEYPIVLRSSVPQFHSTIAGTEYFRLQNEF